MKKIAKILLPLIISWSVVFPSELWGRLALDPLPAKKDSKGQDKTLAGSSPHEGESTWRRGDVVFFISLPFTAMGSFAAVQGYGSLLGQTNPVPSNAQITAALTFALATSFVIAWNDYYYKRHCRTETALNVTMPGQRPESNYGNSGRVDFGISHSSFATKDHYWQFDLVWKTF
jgi:hypothetical protein